MADVVLEQAGKVFGADGGRVVALEELSLAIPERCFATVIGPSGCGKTTVLNLVAGLERRTSGAVRVAGRVVERPGPDRAVVFQDVALFPWLQVQDNIGFGLRVARLPERRVREKVDELLETVGLTEFRRRYPAELSGGMRQRVSIARALALDADVLLMDEPFGSLDAQTRGLMQEFLTGLWERRRVTVLFITHDLDEALFLADRVFVLTARPGRVKATLEVDLPRPRDVAMMASPRFHELRDRARSLVREEALKTMRPLAGQP